MKSFILPIAALAALASAAAFSPPKIPTAPKLPSPPSPSQLQENRCLTLDAFEARNPPCARNCEDLALRYGLDGCAPDDFVCHCRHTERIADLISPCLTPPAINATCSPTDLIAFETSVNTTCAFFNQTNYLDYAPCPNLLIEFLEAGDLQPGH